jgi:hypothetical protein
VSALWLVAGALAADDGEEAIVGGGAPAPETYGPVNIPAASGDNIALEACSGWLLAPGRVLTAAHCLTRAGQEPDPLARPLVWPYRGSAKGHQVTRAWGKSDRNRDGTLLDLAVLELNTEVVPSDGRPISLLRPYRSPPETLVGETVTCWGYSQRAGTELRAGTWTVESVDALGRLVVPMGSGAQAIPGDSGGGCTTRLSSGAWLVGAMSAIAPDGKLRIAPLSLSTLASEVSEEEGAEATPAEE